MAPLLLDVPGAAAALGISTDTLRVLIENRELRPVGLPVGGRRLRKVLIAVADLHAYVERAKEGA